MSTNDDLAAEWDSMSDDDGEEAGSARVLNQDEIDSLLGFDEGTKGVDTFVGGVVAKKALVPKRVL